MVSAHAVAISDRVCVYCKYHKKGNKVLKLSNYINDILENLNSDESGEVLRTDEVKQLLFSLIEKINAEIDEINDQAQDALTNLREADEIYGDDFPAYKVFAGEAERLIENVSLTEMVSVGVWFNNNKPGVQDNE